MTSVSQSATWQKCMNIKPLDYVNNNELFLELLYKWKKGVMKAKSQFHFQ